MNTVKGIFPIAAQLCTEEQLEKRYYPCRCEKCGWQGCSCYLRVERYYEGDADIYCPNCDSTEIEDTNNEVYFLLNSDKNDKPSVATEVQSRRWPLLPK